MPLFSFHCDTCDQSVELLLRNGEAAACPDCGTENMHQEISAFAPVTAGDGYAASPAAARTDAAMGCGTPSCCQRTGGCGSH
jgi:putative FmdB family regulatory protein